MHIVLREEHQDRWEVRFQATTDASNGRDATLYLSKPADYPADL